MTETIHKERYDRFIGDPAWQVITSAAADQYANDSLDIKGDRGIAKTNAKHSPAAALMDALSGKADVYPLSANGKPSGDGVITAEELHMYLRDAVEPATEEHSQRQTPQIWPLKKHGKGEYIFLTPGHPLNLPPAPPLDASKNPYRGLESFDEAHRQLFFGRTELVEKLQDFVKTQPLTVLLGASGSGKSSLVKAGLIPQLRQETTEQWWILPPIRPGEAPLQALNNAVKAAQLPEVAAQNPQQNLAQSIDVWAQEVDWNDRNRAISDWYQTAENGIWVMETDNLAAGVYQVKVQTDNTSEDAPNPVHNSFVVTDLNGGV